MILKRNVIFGRPAQCSASTDYVGNISADPTGDSDIDIPSSVSRAYAFTPVCISGCTSGTSVTAYLYDNYTAGTATNAKICLYNKTSFVPVVGDTLVGCSDVISTAAGVGYRSATISVAVTCANSYWLVLFTDDLAGWGSKRIATQTVYYRNEMCYDSPPANLRSGCITGSWDTVANYGPFDFYITIGP